MLDIVKLLLRSDHKLKCWIGDECQSTVPFDDTIELRSPSVETQLENLDGDTEVLDIPDCIEDMATQMADDYEEEVVLDSDDETVHKTETESKISIRNMFDGNKRSETKCESQDGEKDGALLTSECETAKLNYNESQEAGELSQANALGFLDHYLSFNNMNLSEEVSLTKTGRQKSPTVLCTKGVQSLARRATRGISFGMSGTFEWDDDQIDDGEGNLLNNSKDLLLNGEVPEPRSVTRKLNEVGAVAQVSEMKFVKEIDVQLDAETSGRQLDPAPIGRDVPDIFDIGFDTQMAAEAMEALFCAPPPNSSIDYAHQDTENSIEDSSKGSFSTRVCSNSGVTARKMKQTNRPSKKLRGQISSSFQKNTKNQKELDPELPEAKKVKRGNHFNSGNPTNAKKHSCGSSFKLIELGKEDKALESDTIKEVDKKNSSISVKHDSPGQRPLQGKCMNFSPITHSTRRRSSIYLLKETEDPINSPGQSMSGAMEVGVLEKRRKNGQNADMFQLLKVGGKRCKVGLHVSEEATNIKVNQQAQKEIDVDPGDIHLKLDVWSYPTGKRKNRNVPCPSKGVTATCLPPTLVEGEKGNEYSIGSHKKAQGNSEINCFGLDVIKKPRSSVHARQKRTLQVKKCDQSFLRQSSYERSSADVVNCSSVVMVKKMTSIDPHRVKAGNAKASLPKYPSPVNFTEKGDENCKQFCNKSLSRFPLMKELISLGIPGPLPESASKYLRRRRDMASVRVMFSQNLDDDTIKQQKKMLTHFIADRFVQTRNMLEAIAPGKPVVTHLWLDSCGQASCFIDEKNYILRDAKKEKETGFSMPVSLVHARQHPLLKEIYDRRVFITPNTKPSKDLVTSMVEAAQGRIVDIIQKPEMKNETNPDDLLILSCEQDYAVCMPFLHKGDAIYSLELLLNGIIMQKLEFERPKNNNSLTVDGKQQSSSSIVLPFSVTSGGWLVNSVKFSKFNGCQNSNRMV
ncbi:PAX-interacting protein 1 [Camellia lanceoleosa]|uniref:PAX-interacting protein 1 n=1 Tax=Camellia lanceoleosa TaxID=1840588 RepID=A0ACC0FUY1_9ERIC|nr:PAX-interacting protein 1 [Camellia lanceoleosa]